MDQTQGLAELLRWYVAMGADEAIGAEFDRPLGRAGTRTGSGCVTRATAPSASRA